MIGGMAVYGKVWSVAAALPKAIRKRLSSGTFGGYRSSNSDG